MSKWMTCCAVTQKVILWNCSNVFYFIKRNILNDIFPIEIVKLGKVENEGQVFRATQADEDNFEMTVRAANMVRTKELPF